MRKKFVLLALGATLLFSTQGHGFSLGIQGGANITKFSTTGSTSRTKFMFGGRLELPLILNLYLQTELNFLDYGATEYLGLPVLGKVKIDGDGVNPYLLIGPEFGFKVSGTGVSSTNFSIDFGAGAEFEVAPLTLLFFDVRYSLGTKNLVTGINSKTRSIQILGGLAFGI